VQSNGHGSVVIDLPAEVVRVLDSSRRPNVRVTINDYTFKVALSTTGPRLRLPLRSEVRKEAGIAVGDSVQVDLALGTGESG